MSRYLLTPCSPCGGQGSKGETAFAKVAGQTTRHNYFLVANCCDPTNPDVVYYNPAELVVNPMDADLDAAGYNIINTGSITPLADNSSSLGSSALSWRDVFVGTGGVNIGGTNTITSVSSQLNVSGDWLPATDLAYNLGTTTQRWQELQTQLVNLSDASGSLFWTLGATGSGATTYDIFAVPSPGGTVYSLIQNPGPQGAAGDPPIYRVYAGTGLTGGGATSVNIGALTLAMDATGTVGVTTISYPSSLTTDQFGRLTNAAGGATFQVNAGVGLTGGGVYGLGSAGPTLSLPPVLSGGATTVSYPSAVTIDAYGRVTTIAGGATFQVNAGTGLIGGGVFALGSAGPTLSLPPIGPGATTTTSYPSSITIDPYGRVSSVTGGATFQVNIGTALTGTGGVFALGSAGPTISLPTVGGGATTTTTYPSSVTVDQYGRVTALTGGATFRVNAGTGLIGGGVFALGSAGPTIAMPNVGTAGTYTFPSSVTTDAQGRVTSITSGAQPVNNILGGTGIIVSGSGTSTVNVSYFAGGVVGANPIGFTSFLNLAGGPTFNSNTNNTPATSVNILGTATLIVSFTGRIFTFTTIEYTISNNSKSTLFATKIGGVTGRFYSVIAPNNNTYTTISYTTNFTATSPGSYPVSVLGYWSSSGGNYNAFSDAVNVTAFYHL